MSHSRANTKNSQLVQETQETQEAEEYDADSEFGEAIKALQQAAWHVRLAAFALDEVIEPVIEPGVSIPSPYEWGAVIATANVLAAQIDAVGTQTRRLRKRAKGI